MQSDWPRTAIPSGAAWRRISINKNGCSRFGRKSPAQTSSAAVPT